MLHEFRGYRFRREIGKYVSDAAVARLERYAPLTLFNSTLTN